MSQFRVELLSDKRVETGWDYRPSLGCFQRGFVCLFIYPNVFAAFLPADPRRKNKTQRGPTETRETLRTVCERTFTFRARSPLDGFSGVSVLRDAERHLSGRPCSRKRVYSDQTKWPGANFCPVNSAI